MGMDAIRVFGGVVGLAGSRRLGLASQLANDLVGALHRWKVGLRVGCAKGVDLAFRHAVLSCGVVDATVVHCSSPSRAREVKAMGLHAVCRVADSPTPAAALHRRTVLMVAECSLLVLFPDDPKTGNWGKGSTLAFTTAVEQHIPVFVVTEKPPAATEHFHVHAGSLFGVVDGHWVVPLSFAVRGEVEASGEPKC